MFRRPSLLSSRRAVLHLRAAGDAAVPPDLATWYTERAFHLYVAGLQLPSRGRRLGTAIADLDAACAHLRNVEGMASIIVTAQGRAALAAAQWRDARAGAADALILHAPEAPARRGLTLDIGCPVLVVTAAAARQRARGRHRMGRSGSARLQFGGHVTWLRLPSGGEQADGSGQAQFVAELGRWLGAYMYGQARDQLL